MPKKGENVDDGLLMKVAPKRKVKRTDSESSGDLDWIGGILRPAKPEGKREREEAKPARPPKATAEGSEEAGDECGGETASTATLQPGPATKRPLALRSIRYAPRTLFPLILGVFMLATCGDGNFACFCCVLCLGSSRHAMALAKQKRMSCHPHLMKHESVNLCGLCAQPVGQAAVSRDEPHGDPHGD